MVRVPSNDSTAPRLPTSSASFPSGDHAAPRRLCFPSGASVSNRSPSNRSTVPRFPTISASAPSGRHAAHRSGRSPGAATARTPRPSYTYTFVVIA